MKIHHFSEYVCPRVLKLAWEQKKMGHWVGLHVRNLSGFHDMSFLDLYRDYDSVIIPTEVIAHLHTHRYQPAQELSLADKGLIFWDAHDMPEWRVQSWPDFAPAENMNAQTVYRTYCPEDWFWKSEERKGLVLVSGLSDSGMRHWKPFLDGIKGTELTCISSSFRVKELYARWWEDPMDIQTLIKRLSTFEAGLCGSPFPDANLLKAMPNKLFEYMAAGIPVICVGRSRMADWIEEHDVGVVVSQPEQVEKAIQEVRAKRENVLKLRHLWTMGRECEKVLEAYQRKGRMGCA